MKMIVAYIRHEAFEPIRQDLLEAGYPSLSILEAKGSGANPGRLAGVKRAIEMVQKELA